MSIDIGSIKHFKPLLNTSNLPREEPYRYDGFKTESKILPKGHKKREDARAFPEAVQWDRDQPVKLHDGITIYCDIFRPADLVDEKLPAILNWSPYGKNGSGALNLHVIPFQACRPQSTRSDYESFEGLDPAEWCKRGYAIINADPRGCYDSEGDIRNMGTHEGQDGADLVEWIGSQQWCNGYVGLAGNSWLAIAQWWIAAEQPKHLAAIAPWEGASDLYREVICLGGVPHIDFHEILNSIFISNGTVEDQSAMIREHPLYNEYWEDKRAQFDKILVPMYITASYSTGLHTMGSIRAFTEAKSSKKWLRIHPTQEWYDLYAPENIDDLDKFFSKYLKKTNNDWELTAKVRLSILKFNGEPVFNQKEENYPIPNTEYKRFYLDNDTSTMIPSSHTKYSALTYNAESIDIKDELMWKLVFDGKTRLVGFSKAVLYVSTKSHNELDIYVQLRKFDASGKIIDHINFPKEALRACGMKDESEILNTNIFKYRGPKGALRVSHHITKIEDGGDDISPKYKHDRSKPLIPGEIIMVEIPFWPIGIDFEAGEGVALVLAGHELPYPEFPQMKPSTQNKGFATIHAGDHYPILKAAAEVVPTKTNKTSDKLIKSRKENGRYTNSFNPKFKFPSPALAIKWKMSTGVNTQLAYSKKELDKFLPIIRHNNSEELFRTTSGIRFIWIGHATCYIQMNNFRFLLDPIFSKRCGITSLIGPKRFRPPALTVNDLPENLDAILISHNHFDHLDFRSVLDLNKRYGARLTWFCGLGLRKWFLKMGIRNVIELDWWQKYHFAKKEINIAFCPAQHWSRRTAFDMNRSLWGGYAIWNTQHKFYYAGDTGYTHNISIFQQIGKQYGPFDLSAIPIGAYEPRWMMEAQHVSPDEAVRIHIDVKSKQSIGVHWGTFALANEYFMEPPFKLSQAVKNNLLNSSSFIVLKHGEVFAIS
ncbi:unnamed protein product [Adineta steineri]|uniref:Xaa-Pro dipeptidyl-peptidase C-terminal domain-containing protein n=1 Tax=Adineta steineri TaxID=433720 RepID=A0A814S4X2_9BILA|nr:unnamed protein product [Adineta steineri]CAF1142671.1 unnamed protein product [Adineta steineri]